jgi:hypothetical protein
MGTKRDLEMLRAGIHQAASLALRSLVEATAAEAKSTTLFKDQSGATRSSIHGEVTEPGRRGFVIAGGASKFLENGTRPHTITARNATVLRFVVNGQTVFRRTVHHPGTAELPFMHQALARAEMMAPYAFEEFINYAIHAS